MINFGILTIFFADPANYEAIAEGDKLAFPALREELTAGGGKVHAVLNGSRTIEFTHPLTAEEVKVILAGGKLNCIDAK